MTSPISRGTMSAWFAALAVGLVVVLSSWPLAAAALLPLDLARTRPASADYLRGNPDRPVGIGGRIYEGYLYRTTAIPAFGFATWVVPDGYASFEAFFGIDDTAGAEPVLLNVLLDGDRVKSARASKGQKAVRLSVSVRGGQSLRLELDGGSGGRIAEPRLVSAASAEPGAPPTPPAGPALPSAPFAVDPKDLKTLADSLRSQVDADPAIAERIGDGQVAVATFSLIDIPAPSVAQNVAEDLTTAMIKAKFRLAERGQLDKVLKELKVQNMGLVDPQTAQEVGKLSGCAVILLGSISDRGQFVVINARMMETATGKSLVAEQVEMRKMPIAR